MNIKNTILLVISVALLTIGSQALGYTIQKGDTLWSLANVFNTTIEKLVSDNNIENPNLIYAGQEIDVAGQPQQPSYSIEQLFPSDNQKFGSINFVAGNKFYLSGSGVGTTDTSITVDSFTTPDGIELAMTDFGSIGYATIEPGSSKKEFVSFTGISQAGATTKATLTGVSRGLRFVSPYTASSSLALSHSGGSVLIISNPPQLYNQLAGKTNAESISGLWTFSSTSIPRLDAYLAPTNNAEFVSKKYVDDTSFSGVSNATESVKGIVEIGTKAEIISATTTGSTGAIIVPTIGMVSATTSATTSIVATLPSGKISQGFLDQTEAYTWSGTHSNTATTTLATTTITNMGISGNASISGNLTVSATTSLSTTTVNGVDLKALINGASSNASTLHYHLGNCISGQNSTSSVGTQTITHNLGITPAYIFIYAISSGVGVASSNGVATSEASEYSTYQCTLSGAGQSATNIISLKDKTTSDCDTQRTLANLTSLTSTTFSLNWTPVLGTNYFQWTVCK